MKSNAIKLMLMRLSAVWLTAGMLFSSSSGMVLCIGDEGHVAVEPAHRGHCGSTGKTDDGAQAEAALAGTGYTVTGAGECVDLPLGLDNISYIAKKMRHERILKHNVSQALSAGCLARTYAEEYRTRQPAYGDIPRPAPALLAQRTIVLLI